ncbi:MAG: hypothetical protein IJM26_01025, partial [Lachnospiraceae bacterium]|nr:hypothetical protein [Lachnospiraceae bacterium]
MKNLVKWLLPLLLGLILTAGLSGAAAKAEGSSREKNYVYTEADHALLDRDVFARISEVEASAASTMKVSTGQLTEEDYAAMVPAVIEAVQSSKTYVQGSLQRNGDFLVWQTTVGIPCCYSPRMEAKQHHATDQMSREEMMRIEAEAEAFSAGLRKEASVNTITPGSVEIGLIQPFWESNSDYKDSDFLTYSPYYKSMWASLSEATGGSSDYRFTMENATIDHIASAMENCALVMLDSHGATDYEGSDGDYTSKANCS